VISAPMSAAAGVAARSLQVISPSKALRPMVQMATGAAWEAHNCSQAPLQYPQRQYGKQHELGFQVSLFFSHASSYP